MSNNEYDSAYIQYQPAKDDKINFEELADNIPMRSESEYDAEYVQLRLAQYVKEMNGPEDLAAHPPKEYDFLNVKWEKGDNEIYDADGDGVEDNVSDGWSAWMFDKFYDPAVFHVVEDINNTHHGNLPGMRQKEWDKLYETEPVDHYTLIEDPEWLRW